MQIIDFLGTEAEINLHSTISPCRYFEFVSSVIGHDIFSCFCMQIFDVIGTNITQILISNALHFVV
jgi:hypothetical protein